MSEKKTVYTIAGAHLDTVWNWEFETTLRVFIPATLRRNFELFEKYPHYKFNFEGSFRYELMKEYYPDEFETLRKYVAAGRWYPCGSAYENGDVNVPSPEALFRNILYGNTFFNREFGIRSKDIYLPDCFGFGWTLPSIARHANLNSFITQKLTWGATHPIPFDMGRWYGVNEDMIFASLRPGGYTTRYRDNVRNFPSVKKRIPILDGEHHPFTTAFYGTGDQGGAPDELSVRVVESEIARNDSSDIEVVSAAVNEPFDRMAAMSESDQAQLPSYSGELTMKRHGPGSYTSRAIGKRWNRRNEILAGMAEIAAFAADVNGRQAYPQAYLETAWKRVIRHQFHDDITGTSTEKVYQRSWNEYGMSLNQFASSYTRSVSAIASIMDTNVDGVPVLCHNTLDFARAMTVTIKVPLNAQYVSVTNADGVEVPSQISVSAEDGVTVTFIANMQALSYEVYTVKGADKAYASELQITDRTLENARYIVKINDKGNICSVIDKELNREILSAPIEPVTLRCIGSIVYPAWEVMYTEVKRPAKHPAKLLSAEIVEQGGAKITLKVVQSVEKSILTSYISLTEGGEIVDVQCSLDWRSKRRMLKMAFPFSESSAEATYDLGLGYMKRGNANKNMYEVHGQKWADMSSERYGVSVLSDCKYAWDKPDDETLRLTVVHTPARDFRAPSKQSFLDLGLNLFGYGIYSHAGSVGTATQQYGAAFSTPVSAFVCDKHTGILGGRYVIGEISDPGATIGAVKLAENGRDYVVRIYENGNEARHNVTLKFARPILKASEAYASEEIIGDAKVVDGALVFDLRPFEVKTFLLDIEKDAISPAAATVCTPDANTTIATANGKYTAPIHGADYALPLELLPENITLGNLVFPITNGATYCAGQTIKIDKVSKKLHILAASLADDTVATFKVGDKSADLRIASAVAPLAKWDLVSQKQVADVKSDELALEITHSHSADGDLYGKQFLIFHYVLDVENADSVTLPNDENLLIFSAIATTDADCILDHTALYDIVAKREYTYDKETLIDKLTALRRKTLGGEILGY